jgi:glycosyltransferase involved in cell wall biosynthesis
MISYQRECLSVLSLHWGFSPGGVSRYATLIENVKNYSAIKVKTVCILSNLWQTDHSNLGKVKAELIYIRSRRDVSWVRRLRKKIESVDPDLVLVHGFNGYFVALVNRLRNGNKTPVVCSYHGLYYGSSFPRKFYGHLLNGFSEFFLRRVAVKVVCVSEYTKRYLASKGVDPEKVMVIHNGAEEVPIDEACRHEVRSEWGVNDSDLLFGVVSRLEPVKGVEYFLEAFAKISNKYLEWKVVIIGKGSHEEKLRNRAKGCCVSGRVVFAGYRSDIARCLGAIDIFVLPSLEENHSIAIIEAMRARKAIIATDAGGNTESVRHMEEGLIVPRGDPACMAKAMEMLGSDILLRQTLAFRARQRFTDKFSAETMARRTAEWLVECGRLVKPKSFLDCAV